MAGETATKCRTRTPHVREHHGPRCIDIIRNSLLNITAIVLTSLCLRYLLLLRTMAMGVQIIALIAAHLLLHAPLPWWPIATVMISLAAVTAWSWRRISERQPITEAMMLNQLLFDIAALTVLLYFTGGSWNPFVSLLLLPITVAAATLRPAYTWMLVACATACYTVLMFFHQHTLHWIHGDDHYSPHLWGMWFGFLLSVALVALFVARIGATLRAHDRELAAARQGLALGALAAGTCHELGTPLSTMAVLTKELQHAHSADQDMVERLRVLRTQIERCKQILADMAVQAGQAQADAGGRMSVDQYLAGLLEEWRALRPNAPLRVQLSGTQPGPCIIADRTLSQAIANLLNNAADASPDSVEVEGQWSARELKLFIRDRGPGLPEENAAHAGEAFVTTKPEGMGLGLYLAQLTLSRLGGRLNLHNREAGPGLVAEVTLPLAALLA